MTSRILPRAEWHTLAATPIGEPLALGSLPPGAEILVVETDDGEIVGTWAVMHYVHVHGLWIAPAHRRRAAVLGRLLDALRSLVADWGHGAVLTSADSPEVARLIQRYGGVELPGAMFVFPVRGRG